MNNTKQSFLEEDGKNEFLRLELSIILIYSNTRESGKISKSEF